MGTKADGKLLDNICAVVLGVKEKERALLVRGIIVFAAFEEGTSDFPKVSGLMGCIST